MNFHKRCVFKVPNDCSYKKKRRNSLVGSTNSNSSLGYQSSVSSSVDGETLMIMMMIDDDDDDDRSLLAVHHLQLLGAAPRHQGGLRQPRLQEQVALQHPRYVSSCHVSRRHCHVSSCQVSRERASEKTTSNFTNVLRTQILTSER